MATVAEIKKEVLRIVDQVITGQVSIIDILSFINKGLDEIAGLVLLPELLETDITVDTDITDPYIGLPDDFMRNLHYCYSNTQCKKIEIYDDVQALYRKFSKLDEVRDVAGVAVRSGRLYYQGIPASVETLRIHYYKYPITLTDGTESPTCLPEFMVRPLLVNYVAKELFSIMDSGSITQTNTKKYTNLFISAMAELADYCGEESGEPQYYEMY